MPEWKKISSGEWQEGRKVTARILSRNFWLLEYQKRHFLYEDRVLCEQADEACENITAAVLRDYWAEFSNQPSMAGLGDSEHVIGIIQDATLRVHNERYPKYAFQQINYDNPLLHSHKEELPILQQVFWEYGHFYHVLINPLKYDHCLKMVLGLEERPKGQLTYLARERDDLMCRCNFSDKNAGECFEVPSDGYLYLYINVTCETNWENELSNLRKDIGKLQNNKIVITGDVNNANIQICINKHYEQQFDKFTELRERCRDFIVGYRSWRYKVFPAPFSSEYNRRQRRGYNSKYRHYPELGRALGIWAWDLMKDKSYIEGKFINLYTYEQAEEKILYNELVHTNMKIKNRKIQRDYYFTVKSIRELQFFSAERSK